MSSYTIGIDFGSMAGRLVLVDISDGTEMSSIEISYQHKNLEHLFDYSKLAMGTVLQHPQDYLDVIFLGIPELISQANILPNQIIGIGIAATTSTDLAVDKNATPLCFYEEYKNRPHAYIKLWKDHSAQKEADTLNIILDEENQGVGKISAEWLIPKAMHILNNDREIFLQMDKFIEVGDWLVWKLTGKKVSSTCQASYTKLWSEERGYFSNNVFMKIAPEFENFVQNKLLSYFSAPTESAGFLLEDFAEKLGLQQKVSVSVSNIDAHATLPAVGITKPGKILSILGTSACHLLLSDMKCNIKGAMRVKNGIIPGFYAYISSQVAVGDCFEWYFKNLVPYKYYEDALKHHKSLYDYMEDKLLKIEPGTSGLVALDWWNGLRQDSNFSGTIVGVNVNTKPEEIYLCLLESTAYGLRSIIECYENKGIKIDEICVAGGIAHKNRCILQIYSNITKKPIRMACSKKATALGGAIFASVAAGIKNGGYESISIAANKMGNLQNKVYIPQNKYAKIYDKLYDIYQKLSRYFENNVSEIMKELRNC